MTAAAGRGKGSRLGLLWVLGGVIAALLLAGAMGLGSGPMPAPRVHDEPARTQPSPPATAAAPAPERSLAPPSEPAASADTAEPAPWAGPGLAVKARFRVRPAGEQEEDLFARGCPIALLADGRLVSRGYAPEGMRLPVGTRAARFHAPGYRPVERAVPAPLAGTVDFGDVVFEPDAAVRLCLSGAPVANGQLQFTVGRMLSFPYAQVVAMLADGAAEAVLPAPSGEDLQVAAFALPTRDQNVFFGVEPRTIRLQSGETATIALQTTPGGRVTVQVHGPSPALLPHLSVQLTREQANGTFHPDRTSPLAPLDAAGRAVFVVPPGRCDLGVRAGSKWQTMRDCTGGGFVHTLADGAVLDVTPTEPLVGVMVIEDGKPVRSHVSLRGPIGGPHGAAPAAECHAFLRSELLATAQLCFWTQAAGSRACSATDLRIDGDLVSIDAARGRAQARLRVLADVPDEYHSALWVEAQPVVGGAVVRIGTNRSPFEALLPAGAYTVRWRCSGTPGPVIEGPLELAAGETRELSAAVPVLQTWKGRIADHATLGPMASPAGLRMHGIWSLGGVAPGGMVPILLPESPVVGGEADITLPLLKMSVPGRITEVMATDRSFVVEHGVTAADLVQLHSRGLGSGRRQIWLCSQNVDNRNPAWLSDRAAVPMLPGSERHGCLVELVESQNQVTCWFTLQHGAREVVLEPRGEWATVRLERPAVHARILIEGWPGIDPIEVGQLLEQGERRIFVAAGTRAVHVDLVPKERVSFAPGPVELVVR